MNEDMKQTDDDLAIAMRISELWGAGKMIGGDGQEVSIALLAEVKRLRARVAKFESFEKEWQETLMRTLGQWRDEVKQLQSDRAALVERVIARAVEAAEDSLSDASKYDVADAIRALDRNKLLEGK